jgi:glycine amidinotransferase
MHPDSRSDTVSPSPVYSHNEWDPLEEVIVGRLEGATIPSNHITVTFSLPRAGAKLYGLAGGWRYPTWMKRLAQRDLDGFIELLRLEGVKVRRPDTVDLSRSYSTPWWSSRGFCVACPLDSFLVIGDEIIESPMCWRSRYFEAIAYRSLFKEYFHAGARWTPAPRPMLRDDLYNYNYGIPECGASMRYIVNEFEPVFDAADFVRWVRDLFVTRSNVTNLSGTAWLRRHLGDGYRIHEIESRCRLRTSEDRSKRPGAAAFRKNGLVSGCAVGRRQRHPGRLSPGAIFGVSFLMRGGQTPNTPRRHQTERLPSQKPVTRKIPHSSDDQRR